MALWVLGILAAAVGFPTDFVLLGWTSRPHLPQGGQLGFDLLNPLVAVSLDGMARLWRVPSSEEIETAEKKQKTP